MKLTTKDEYLIDMFDKQIKKHNFGIILENLNGEVDIMEITAIGFRIDRGCKQP
jgi:hypothetical protein